MTIIIFLFYFFTSVVFCNEISNQNNTSSVKIFEKGRGMSEDYHHDDVVKPKSEKPWLGYYDFLITEGSYKFWVVFQLFTVGLLIYSAFAAIYYAKYTINDYENYDDYLLGRSSRTKRYVPSPQTEFLGLPVETYLQIFNAIYNYSYK
ncbi:hypothetical protein Phum_PHUM506480 [Pediculus humanus corporis]|uniref:Uncharacterized protein n=1 Tax=Pediculus humanus subsp. corporis TaxID=121224 RepID=E0VXX8_PEDHC|nr:uncharacterized protein Phum_PHUM506480 [Pediculus humanus corporis]EEB18234.1 hypothetical protein Phum_PHUM506480 [Pediculus humanus corporis]